VLLLFQKLITKKMYQGAGEWGSEKEKTYGWAAEGKKRKKRGIWLPRNTGISGGRESKFLMW